MGQPITNTGPTLVSSPTKSSELQDANQKPILVRPECVISVCTAVVTLHRTLRSKQVREEVLDSKSWGGVESERLLLRL